MSVAIDQPFRRRRMGRTGVVDVAGGGHGVVAARPMGLWGESVLIVLLGAWAGIAVFVGPLFNYSPTTTTAWSWTMNNWLLHLIPGAVAVFAGLVLLASTPGRRETTRGMVALMSLLVICSAIWLVIGPDVWTLTRNSPVYSLAASTNMGFLFRIGANLGPGVLLAVLGGMALRAGTAMPGVELVTPAGAPADMAAGPVVAAAPAAGTAVADRTAAVPASGTAVPVDETATATPAAATATRAETAAPAATATPAAATATRAETAAPAETAETTPAQTAVNPATGDGAGEGRMAEGYPPEAAGGMGTEAGPF